MYNHQQAYLLHRPPACARALATPHENKGNIPLVVGYTLASAIIVLWMTYLPILINTILTKLNIVP
jgi:hypothetical protein